MQFLLGLIAALLAAILITLLGWWSAFGILALAAVGVVGLLWAVAIPIRWFNALAERDQEKEHHRLVQSLPPLATADDEIGPMLRDLAVWEWMSAGRPGELAKYVNNYVERISREPSASGSATI